MTDEPKKPRPGAMYEALVDAVADMANRAEARRAGRPIPHREFDPSAYESPIEEWLAYDLLKLLAAPVVLVPQREVSTRWATFRPDFLLTTEGGRRIAIECDGKEFHDSYRDEWRDVLLLGSGALDVIYRFDGSALFHNIFDCLFVMAHFERDAFSERGHANLDALASKVVRDTNWNRESEETEGEGRWLQWQVWTESDLEFDVDGGPLRRWQGHCERRSASSRARAKAPFPWCYWDFAQKHRGASLDELIEAWRQNPPRLY